MLLKISNSFLYTQKVAYLVRRQVILICSNPTCLHCIAYQTRSKYDQPTLYCRPSRCSPAQHTTWGERDRPRPFFNQLKNWSHSPQPLRSGQTNPAVFIPPANKVWGGVYRNHPVCLSVRLFTSCPGHNFLTPCLIWIIFHTIIVHDPRMCNDLDPR